MADLPEPGPWMMSVAELIRVLPNSPIPFTLGEAVAELGLWARTARDESWVNQLNQQSLDDDIASSLTAVGPRLRELIDDLLPTLVTGVERRAIMRASAEFAERWRQPVAVSAAFRDLSEAAANESYGSWHLQPTADILASQVAGAHRSWSLLDEASTMLAGEPQPFQLEHFLGRESDNSSLTPFLRLEITHKILDSNGASGRIVVWLLYRRANVGHRMAAGPITFLRPDWAIPNATRMDGQAFEERDELRGLLEGPLFPNESELLSEEAAGERYVLVRVDLGERIESGARDDAARQVEALLNIAVGAGGVSWINTGTSVTLVDGRRGTSSFGMAERQRHETFHDSYGINATGELLYYWSMRLDSALRSSAMPDFLVEALAALREAGMIDHRDVMSYDARPVTPRVALALQDHAVELIASFAQMRPKELVSAMEHDLSDQYADQFIVSSVLAPLNERHLSASTFRDAGSLKYWLAPPEPNGVRFVRLERVWEARSRLQAIEVSPVVRAGLRDGLAAISSSAEEMIVLGRARQTIQTLRSRHRRVRNAVTHGNPVTPPAIESVRDFSDRLARGTLNLALQSFATGGAVSDLLAAKCAAREADRIKMAAGISRVDRIAEAHAAETPPNA